MESPLRILHLEDEALDSELVLELLCAEGLEVVLERVATLPEFEAALQRESFALVLSDYSLPGVNPLMALELARRLRPETAFIFVSGTIGEDRAIEALRQGASDYVLKQRLERLGPAVRRALREAREQGRRQQAERALRQAQDQLAQANRELERKVQERTAQLVEANANLQAFAYTAAHDLRSPLRGIRNFCRLTLEEYGAQLGADGQSLLERVVGAGDQMARLLDDLLEYSKLSQTGLRLEPVELRQAVSEAMALLGEEIRGKAAQVTVGEPLPAVHGHLATMVMLLSNLISNGLKFMPAGVQPRIRIRAERQPMESAEGSPGRFIRLWVEDNGIGIAPEYWEKVFGAFERLHGKDAYPGTGLGLALVRKGAERMGGRAGVKSEPGKGSRFWVELREIR